MARTPFKLKSKNDFNFGNKEASTDFASNDENDDENKISEFATKFVEEKEKEEASDLELYSDAYLNPEYNGKRLSLKGSLKPGDGTEFGWNADGGLTPYGGPTVNFKNRAGLSGEYKVGKNTTIGGSVNFETGKKPVWGGGIKINI